LLVLAAAVIALAAAGGAVPSRAAAAARLLIVTSPVSRGSDAELVARVTPSRRCTISVLYKSRPLKEHGLDRKRPVHGRVRWTWLVRANTKPGTLPIHVSCGSAGSFRTSVKVTR
jgi:hypothetical protein